MLYICTAVRKRINEGTRSPLFLYLKMFEDKVRSLLDQCLNERQDLFLIDFSLSNDNAIKIVIDGDNGVLVEDCIYISRAIEHSLDRDEHDFSIEVLSSGATTPLVLPRQYKKHIGRNLEVKTEEGTKIQGQLIEANDEGVLLKWKTRESKPVGKGKVTVTKEANIAFENIKEAKVKIKF